MITNQATENAVPKVIFINSPFFYSLNLSGENRRGFLYQKNMKIYLSQTTKNENPDYINSRKMFWNMGGIIHEEEIFRKT